MITEDNPVEMLESIARTSCYKSKCLCKQVCSVVCIREFCCLQTSFVRKSIARFSFTKRLKAR